MRGLTIIWESSTYNAVRSVPSHLPFEMLLVQLALGGRATLFVRGPAVMHLRAAATKRDQLIPKLAGLPQLHTLFDELLEAGGRVIVCQAGLAKYKLSMTALDPRIQAGGLVSVMQGLRDDRLVVI